MLGAFVRDEHADIPDPTNDQHASQHVSTSQILPVDRGPCFRTAAPDRRLDERKPRKTDPVEARSVAVVASTGSQLRLGGDPVPGVGTYRGQLVPAALLRRFEAGCHRAQGGLLEAALAGLGFNGAGTLRSAHGARPRCATGRVALSSPGMGVRSIDHVGVVVDDLEAATSFFLDLGLERAGGGRWMDKVVGLDDVRTKLVIVRTPDGCGKLGLTKYHTPADDEGAHRSQANQLGFRHIAFVVSNLDTIVAGLRAKGFDTVGEVEDYEDTFRLCYLRGPEGLLVELAERIASEENGLAPARCGCRECHPPWSAPVGASRGDLVWFTVRSILDC